MAIGSTEIVILVVFGILIFGANKIPQLARGVGRAKGEFQMGMKEASEMAAIGDMDRGGMTEEIASEQIAEKKRSAGTRCEGPRGVCRRRLRVNKSAARRRRD